MSTVLEPDDDQNSSHLSVGFVLLPHFTLLPFAAFIDALRLAADEADGSRQVNCSWTVMGQDLEEVASSCGVNVRPWETFRDPGEFDYVVVVGGLLHQGPTLTTPVLDYLQRCAQAHIPLVGLCTGSIALVRAGLMSGRRCCVSWFHYRDLMDEFADVIPVADQLYVDDGDRITCSGGAGAADLAATLIERHLGRSWARKSLRIMGIDEPRPGNAPQPPPTNDYEGDNKRVKRVLLLLEQNMSRPLSTDEIARGMNLSKRQLERLFVSETGESLQKLYRMLRLRYSLWMLRNSTRSVTDIAQECGFSDAPHFSRAFRAVFDKKPSEYREENL